MSTPFLGEIMMFAGNFAPRGWAMCNGQLMAISQNSALFSLLGTTYGGNGVTTFGLPNLQGRMPVHQGGIYSLGGNGGAEAVTLNVTQMPSHHHAARCTSNAGTHEGPSGSVWASDASGATAEYDAPTGLALSPNAIGPTPSSSAQSHDNMQPYLTISYCIALVGVFPTRN